MDLLSSAIAEIGLHHARYQRVRLEPPGTRMFSPTLGGIHLLTRGRAVLEVTPAGERRQRILLDQGDLVLVPRGIAHQMSTGSKAVGASSLEILCGVFSYSTEEHPLLSAIPQWIVVPFARGQAMPRFHGYLHALAQEVDEIRPGTETILARLSEIVLVEAVRQIAESPIECPRAGWLRGMRDPAIHRALSAFHEAPGKNWSVAILAAAAGQSRSAFSAHFGARMGEAPMTYVRRWRMYRVRNLLRTTDLSLHEIAKQTGYASAAALSVAFTREHRRTPGRFRNEASAG